jgi:selenocysteine lyase/cysteine desulfurase
MVLFAHMSVHLVSEDFFLSKKNQISFTALKPADWLVCRWLQLFGYPTGLGALLVRNGKHKIHIPWLYGSSYSCQGKTNLVAPFKFPEITDRYAELLFWVV